MSEALLVIGGGISGITAAVEAAESGYEVYLVEREPYLGGRVARFHRYFPKLCPPYCGLEINFRRIKQNPRVHVITQAEVEEVLGSAGAFDVTLRLHPRFVDLDRCTACGACAEVCPAERPDDFNYGMATTKAAYLPHAMAMPMKYAIDGEACLGESCGRCVTTCPTQAIDLRMQPRSMRISVAAITVATGWQPYDASRLAHLGFGIYPDVITNVMMERLAAPNGPTQGRILRPSDGAPAKSVAFVQCAGSRDQNHLPYCSGVCCLGSMKQAMYFTEAYPGEARAYVFYIDIRSPGEYEDFYTRVRATPEVSFVKGKVARVSRGAAGQLVVEADDMLHGGKREVSVDLVVLAAGMVPSLAQDSIPGLGLQPDAFGFAEGSEGVSVVGVARHPVDVTSSTREATGAVIRMIQVTKRSEAMRK